MCHIAHEIGSDKPTSAGHDDVARLENLTTHYFRVPAGWHRHKAIPQTGLRMADSAAQPVVSQLPLIWCINSTSLTLDLVYLRR